MTAAPAADPDITIPAIPMVTDDYPLPKRGLRADRTERFPAVVPSEGKRYVDSFVTQRDLEQVHLRITRDSGARDRRLGRYRKWLVVLSGLSLLLYANAAVTYHSLLPWRWLWR